MSNFLTKPNLPYPRKAGFASAAAPLIKASSLPSLQPHCPFRTQSFRENVPVPLEEDLKKESNET